MKLSSSFIKLPLRFDPEQLAKEALQFTEEDWTYHPLRHQGNTALALVSVDGKVNDRFEGPMLPTPYLRQCPYAMQVIATFQTVVGRSRFMRLSANADVPSHNDGNYTWRNRVRIHIPIITHPDIVFSSVGDVDVHMAAGEAWIFDNWRQHAVYNRTNVDRIHLVIDTVGTSDFWKIVKAGWDPTTPEDNWAGTVKYQPFQADCEAPDLIFERYNALPVRSPDEIDNMLADLLNDLGGFKVSSPDRYHELVTEFEQFRQDWRSYWALYWDNADSISYYELLAKRLKVRVKPLIENVTFDSNEANAYEVAAGWISSTTDASLSDRREAANVTGSSSTNGSAPFSKPESGLSLAEYIDEFSVPIFKGPVFIVAAPRSGSTMLFEALQKNKDFWTIGDESQREVESIPGLHPRNRDFESNELTAEDYSPQVGALLMDAFMSRLQNAGGSGYLQTPEELRPGSIRFLEKTPKNSLRIAFFRKMFPDAKYIFLHRAAEPNIGSMIDAWLSQKFVTYPNLPDWEGPEWSLLLPAGWQSMRGRSIAEIAAWQWATTNERILRDLMELPRSDWVHVSYEALLAEPAAILERLCEFAGVPYGPRMQATAKQGFPISRSTLSPPKKNKWLQHRREIEAAASLYSAVAQTLSQLD